MILTDEQIEYIDTNLKFYGVASEELRNDLLDHICTYIEENDFPDFETAYREALQKFGGYAAMGSIQRETYLQVTFRKVIRQKIMLYCSGVLSALLFSAGLFFKMMHWKGGNILLGCSFLIATIIILPLYFYQRYRTSVTKLYKDGNY